MAKAKEIETLTPAQEQSCLGYVDKWMEIGRRTAPIDYDKTVAAAEEVYAAVKLKLPKKIIVAKSPIDAIEKIVEHNPQHRAHDVYTEFYYNQMEAAWLAFYDFCLHELGMTECKNILPLMELAQHAGWLSMYEDVLVIQERPNRICFDENDRLHSETGPVVSFPDGQATYAWHGTRIPGEWIEDKSSITLDTCINHPNIEQRRCAAEIYGWARLLEDNKDKVRIIDEHPNPIIGKLLETNLGDGVGVNRFLYVKCGTGRAFAIPVPNTMRTALEANAASYRLDPARLDPSKPTGVQFRS